MHLFNKDIEKSCYLAPEQFLAQGTTYIADLENMKLLKEKLFKIDVFKLGILLYCIYTGNDNFIT